MALLPNCASLPGHLSRFGGGGLSCALGPLMTVEFTSRVRGSDDLPAPYVLDQEACLPAPFLPHTPSDTCPWPGLPVRADAAGSTRVLSLLRRQFHI